MKVVAIGSEVVTIGSEAGAIGSEVVTDTYKGGHDRF